MSYALRNTIVLLVTLFLFIGAGVGFTQFYQKGIIEDLQTDVSAQQNDFNSKKEISDQYPGLLNRYIKAKEIVEGYDKSLFASVNPDLIYEYLNDLSNNDLEIYFDYIFQDSLNQGEYGIVDSEINGIGLYGDVVKFIVRLENSELLNKVENINIVPNNSSDDINMVDFSFELKSYYQTGSYEQDINGETDIKLNNNLSTFNPFKPLILSSIPENTDNLVNVEKSRLLGITGSRVFLVDQDGQRQTLKIGDVVYLGYLLSIDTSKREVLFDLDKGGIKEQFTLKVIR